MKRSFILSLILVVLLPPAASAFRPGVSAFPATAPVLPLAGPSFGCSVTATSVNFGTYDVFSPAPDDSTGSIAVNCNNPGPGTNVQIAISPGNSGSFSPRQMRQTAGPGFMSYNLYIDPSRTSVWGDGTANTSTVTANVRRNVMLNQPIYGRIPALQNLSVGSYGDVLTVTVAW